MRILLVSSCDYANLSHSWGKALRSIGVDAVDVCTSKHKFKYLTQSSIVSIHTLKALIEDADHVLIMHSDESFLPYLNGKPYSVAHTGTRYRSRPLHYNYIFRDAHSVITDQTEFMRLIPNANFLVSAIDERIYNPIKRKSDKLIIGHFPSVAETKGTPKIIEMLKPFQDDFEMRIDTTKVDHALNLKRINECDIYIELFKHSINGNPYGCFGVTALEAAMMGKAVITMDVEFETYLDEYGYHPFNTVQDEDEFIRVIQHAKDHGLNNLIFGFSPEQIHLETKRLHSFEATGERLIKILSKKMELPKVTVIIGHNNSPDRAEYLIQAKKSLDYQTYKGEIELLNVGTSGSISRNLNLGLAEATGEFVKYLSDDDMLTDNCIEDCVNAMRNADFIHGNAITLKGDTKVRYCPPMQFHEMTLEQMNAHPSNPIHGGTTMFRLSDLKAIALPNGQIFDESLDCAEEMDVYYRLWKAGKKLSYVNKDLYIYRKHDGQKSLGKDVDQEVRFKKIQAIKDRYR